MPNKPHLLYWSQLNPSSRLIVLKSIVYAYESLSISHWNEAEIFINRARSVMSHIGIHACHIHSELDFLQDCLDKKTYNPARTRGYYHLDIAEG